jgi:hypothetical protein
MLRSILRGVTISEALDLDTSGTFREALVSGTVGTFREALVSVWDFGVLEISPSEYLFLK